MWPTPLKVAKEEEETKQAGFHLQQLWLPVGLVHNRWFEERFLLMFLYVCVYVFKFQNHCYVAYVLQSSVCYFSCQPGYHKQNVPFHSIASFLIPLSQPIFENNCKLYSSLARIVRESAANSPIHSRVSNMKLPPPENTLLNCFKAFPTSSQKTSAVEGYPVIIAIGMKRLDTFNYSSATGFLWTSKTKLVAAEDSGYMGLS